MMPGIDLEKIHNEPLHLAHDKARRRRLGDQLFFAVCIVIICFVVLPVFYALVPIRIPFEQMLQGEQLAHILLNSLANALVLLGALRLREDQLDRKLGDVLSLALVVHGLLAFFILVTRQPHSNLILLSAACVSMLGGMIIIYTLNHTVQPKIAMLGPLVGPLDFSRVGPCDHVMNPQVDLRPYDILLTASMVDLSPEWAGAISRAMIAGKRVRHLAEFAEERCGLVAIDHFDVEHLPAGGLTSYRTRKRLLDICLILLTAPISIPVLLMAMLIVRVTMGSPVLFIQERIGMGGRPFQMYKLRTMRPPPTNAPVRTTAIGDARVTAVGKVFRRYRIDELPQLWNVLKGEMSIVGPRPEWTTLSLQYAAELPVYNYRNLVRPGITGWAQVRGGYAGDLAETRAKVAYDLFYIKNLSFALDVQILIRTVWTLVSGSGAR